MFSASSILGRPFRVTTLGLDGLAQRQRAHAYNLANVNTKGFKPVTVSFEHTLKQIANGGPGTVLGGIGDGVSGAEMLKKPIKFRQSMNTKALPYGQSSGVNRTYEVNAMMQDQVRFRVLTRQTNVQIRELRNVLNEMGKV